MGAGELLKKRIVAVGEAELRIQEALNRAIDAGAIDPAHAESLAELSFAMSKAYEDLVLELVVLTSNDSDAASVGKAILDTRDEEDEA